MKLKHLMVPALALIATQAEALTVIYNTVTNPDGGVNTIRVTGTLPRHRMGGAMSTSLAPPGLWWRVHRVEVVLVAMAAGTYDDWRVRMQFFNDWTPDTPVGTPVFGGLASDVTWTMPTLTPTGPAAWIFTLDYQAANLSFDLADGQTIGFVAHNTHAGVADNRLTLGITEMSTTVGTSGNIFYRDANNDGIMDGQEQFIFGAWPNANPMIRLHAEAVPEPATLLVLGAGAAALAARRRRKK